MKKNILYLLTLFLIPEVLGAQVDPLKFFFIDNPVPTAPAFKILGDDYEGEKTLRPGSFQDFSVNISPLLTGKTLPASFSIEFTPRIFGGSFSTSFSKYKSDWLARFFARTKFSLATGEQKTNSKQAASWGVRFTVFDDSDPLLDTMYISSLLLALKRDVEYFQTYKRKTIEEFYDITKKEQFEIGEKAFNEAVKVLINGGDADRLNGFEKEMYYSIIQKECSNTQRTSDFYYKQSEERKKQLEEKWTKNIFEFGIAQLFNSPNSEFVTLQSQKAQFWLTLGLSLAEKTSQLMLSVSGTVAAVSDSSRINTALRWYLGAATKKMYLEVNHVARGGKSYQGNILLGGEFSLGNRLWLDVNAGAKREDRWYFTKNIGFRFGL